MMDKAEKAMEIWRRLDELREEAEEEGLALVASWRDKKGNTQSVQLGDGDALYVTVRL